MLIINMQSDTQWERKCLTCEKKFATKGSCLEHVKKNRHHRLETNEDAKNRLFVNLSSKFTEAIASKSNSRADKSRKFTFAKTNLVPSEIYKDNSNFSRELVFISDDVESFEPIYGPPQALQFPQLSSQQHAAPRLSPARSYSSPHINYQRRKSYSRPTTTSTVNSSFSRPGTSPSTSSSTTNSRPNSSIKNLINDNSYDYKAYPSTPEKVSCFSRYPQSGSSNYSSSLPNLPLLLPLSSHADAYPQQPIRLPPIQHLFNDSSINDSDYDSDRKRQASKKKHRK